MNRTAEGGLQPSSRPCDSGGGGRAFFLAFLHESAVRCEVGIVFVSEGKECFTTVLFKIGGVLGKWADEKPNLRTSCRYTFR